ncbi:hypothetical protein [Maioricimonas sp. JC845]|uniref:hypothetical protein n=1 Tax=Maioricimonas sp. JC845 TaxID=3232138 RepID=UPI003459366D
MFARPRQREWRRARRLTGLLLLLSMCASLFPLPLPVRSPAGKDQSRPFPCQDRPCGCMSAAQCWRKCCCFTDREKLAWARANDVTPPAFVVASAHKERTAKDTTCGKTCTACETPTGDSPTSRPACCDGQSGQREAPGRPTEDATRDETHYVLTTAMLRCQGGSLIWNALPWAIVPVRECAMFPHAPTGWERPGSVVSDMPAPEPPDPPPRLI